MSETDAPTTLDVTPATPEQQPQPAPEATTPQPSGDPRQQTFDADYVAKLRAESAKYRTEAKANAEAAKRLAEIEDAQKTEAQKAAEQLQALQQENARLQAEALKAQVAATKGVPADLLSGATEDELNAAADRLLAFRGAPQTAEYGRTTNNPKAPKQLTKADLANMSPQEIVDADKAGLLDDVKAGRT